MGKKKKLLLSDFDEECFNDADVAFGETNQIFIFVIQYISLFRKKIYANSLLLSGIIFISVFSISRDKITKNAFPMKLYSIFFPQHTYILMNHSNALTNKCK